MFVSIATDIWRLRETEDCKNAIWFQCFGEQILSKLTSWCALELHGILGWWLEVGTVSHDAIYLFSLVLSIFLTPNISRKWWWWRGWLKSVWVNKVPFSTLQARGLVLPALERWGQTGSCHSQANQACVRHCVCPSRPPLLGAPETVFQTPHTHTYVHVHENTFRHVYTQNSHA